MSKSEPNEIVARIAQCFGVPVNVLENPEVNLAIVTHFYREMIDKAINEELYTIIAYATVVESGLGTHGE